MTQHDPTVAALQEIARAVHEIATRPQNDLLNTILKEIQKMSAQLDQLKADVAAEKTVIDSAVALLGGLAQQIRDLAEDPAALSQLATDIESQTASLAAAVTANTPTPKAP